MPLDELGAFMTANEIDGADASKRFLIRVEFEPD